MSKSLAFPPIAGVSELAASSDADTQSLIGFYDRLRIELSAALQRNLDRLEQETSWALLHAMNGRAMEHQAACIGLYSHQYYAPAEALCRTVLEASINLYYSSLGDSCSILLSYFRSHIEMERRQNKSWLASVNASKYPEPAKAYHRQRIKGKEEALNWYEGVLTEAFSQIGISYASVEQEWPSVFDRFKAINKEVSYRTVYAALCSQAHNDAEDLLNEFVCGVSQVEGMHEMQACENRNFSLFMVLTSMAFLVEATVMYLAKFNLGANEPFQQLLTDIRRFTEQVTSRMESISLSSKHAAGNA